MAAEIAAQHAVADSIVDSFDLFTDDLRIYVLQMLDAQQV